MKKDNGGKMKSTRETENSNSNRREKVSEERERLKCVTQDTRFALIQTILSHPQQMPSLKEIVFSNFEKSPSTIRGHLDELMDCGVVTIVTLPDEERSRDLPWKFFAISEEGHEFLQEHNLLASEGILRDIYSKTAKPDAIQKYEAAPRPDGDELEGVYQAGDEGLSERDGDDGPPSNDELSLDLPQ